MANTSKNRRGPLIISDSEGAGDGTEAPVTAPPSPDLTSPNPGFLGEEADFLALNEDSRWCLIQPIPPNAMRAPCAPGSVGTNAPTQSGMWTPGWPNE